ncbi:MAG: hypothetical protein Q4E99_05430, partial [Bacillota bacterium]|nr:hypothetical protein [Bacillota bacterium]
GFENPDTLVYHSDTFIAFENEQIIDADFINRNCDFISSETDHAENKMYKRRKVKAFIKAPISKKVLWIKQRIATREVISNHEYFGENYSNT